jgi:RHS repeat-associated protein
MTQAVTEKGQANYTYDGFMNRISRLEQFTSPAREPQKTGSIRQTRFILDMALPRNNHRNNLLQTQTTSYVQSQADETANNPNPNPNPSPSQPYSLVPTQTQTQSYIWGRGLLSTRGTEAFHYLTDPLGSPIRLVGLEEDPHQLPLAYDAFGVPQVDAAGKVEGNPFGFMGYLTDDISGLYDTQAGYYNPVTARFVSENLMRENLIQDGINNYVHCYNDPINPINPKEEMKRWRE